MNEYNKNLGPYRATKLWNEVVRNFRSQMPRKRHRKHVRHFDDCFTSSEAIDWLHCYMQNNTNFNSSVTREQTLQLLRKFVENGLFEDVRGGKCIDPDEFKDNGELYRFNKKSPMKLTRTPRMPLLKQNVDLKDENREEIKPELPKCHLVARQLSVIDLENTWKNIILKRLQEKLELPNLDAIIDTESINAKFIIHNAMKVNKNGVVICLDKSNDLPHWVISAMKCLANWPNASGSGSCLPNYPGFQMDVFSVIKDYFKNLDTPLLTYEIFINTFVRSEYLDSGRKSSTSNTEITAPALILSCKSLETFFSTDKHATETQNHLSTNETSILSSEQIMGLTLPPSLCFETAFTSEEPITRIIPHQNSFSNSANSFKQSFCQSPFYLHEQKNLSHSLNDNSSVRRLKGKTFGYDNLAYLVPKSEESNNGEIKIRNNIQREDSSLSSYHTVPSEMTADLKRSSGTASSASYKTPCGDAHVQPQEKLCSWPSKRQAIEQWVKNSCWPDLTETGKQLAIDVFQLLTLSLPPDTRRKLHLLLRFMNLVLQNDHMLETFSRCILKSDDYNELLATRICNFLIDNYQEIFTVPKELHSQVQERLIYLSREKVSKQQYESQKENHSRRALKDLLDNILEDEKLDPKEKRKKLKKFKEAYPDIYIEKMLNEEKLQIKKQQKVSSKLNLLQRMKSLRI